MSFHPQWRRSQMWHATFLWRKEVPAPVLRLPTVRNLHLFTTGQTKPPPKERQTRRAYRVRSENGQSIAFHVHFCYTIERFANVVIATTLHVASAAFQSPRIAKVQYYFGQALSYTELYVEYRSKMVLDA